MSAINIKTLEVLEGDLPEKALKLVREWIILNQKEIIKYGKNKNLKK